MTALRTALFLAVSTVLFACGGTTDGSGTGGGGGSQTCTTNHECINGACRCTSGTKNGSSCCNPSDSSCSTAEQCPAFCRTCN